MSDRKNYEDDGKRKFDFFVKKKRKDSLIMNMSSEEFLKIIVDSFFVATNCKKFSAGVFAILDLFEDEILRKLDE